MFDCFLSFASAIVMVVGNFRQAILVTSRKNHLRYLIGLVPELEALGLEIGVLLIPSGLQGPKSHLEVDREMACLLRERFPSVAVNFVNMGEELSPAIDSKKREAVFISVSPPDEFAPVLSSKSLPWIQIQHASDLHHTNGLSSKKADGFLLWGAEWISDRVRNHHILAPFYRDSIDYVRSKPVAFPGHFGLNAIDTSKNTKNRPRLDSEGTVLLFDPYLVTRGGNALRTFAKAALFVSRFPSEIRDLRMTVKKLLRQLEEEQLEIFIRPRLKGLPLPLGYPRGTIRTGTDLAEDDPSEQILASNGIISLFPSHAVLEALYLGRPVLGIDWQGFMSPRDPFHSGIEKIWGSELRQSSAPGFRVVGPKPAEFSVRDFFAESDLLGTFDMAGWISPPTRKREELARLLFEVSVQR